MNQLLAPINLVLPTVAGAWIVHFLNQATGDRLSWACALKPRSLSGLYGILSMPFVHADARHLATNSAAFLVLGSLIAVQGASMFVAVSIALVVVTGLILWLFSPNPVIGGSGVVFGYLGYLLSFGLTVDSGLPVAAGFLAFVTYGGMWIGVFPRDPEVSWLAHAAGFAAGLILGHYLGLRAIGLGVHG